MISSVRVAWKRLRQRFWLSLMVDAALILAVFIAIHAWQTRNLPIEERAPPTELRLLGGQANLPLVEPGSVGVVYFFAPWCFYCRHSISNLDKLVSHRKVAWARAVALSYDTEKEVADFIAETGVRFPVVMGNADTARDWAVSAFPTYYVIDANGVIASRSVGYSTWLGMWLRSLLA